MSINEERLSHYREGVRAALRLYKSALEEVSRAEGPDEDIIVSLTQVESAARVLWFEDLT